MKRRPSPLSPVLRYVADLAAGRRDAARAPARASRLNAAAVRSGGAGGAGSAGASAVVRQPAGLLLDHASGRLYVSHLSIHHVRGAPAMDEPIVPLRSHHLPMDPANHSGRGGVCFADMPADAAEAALAAAAARNEARSVEPIIRTWSLVGVRVDHTGDWIDGEVEGGEAGGELVPRLGML